MFLMNLKIKPGVDVTRPKGSHMSCKVKNDPDNIEGMFEKILCIMRFLTNKLGISLKITNVLVNFEIVFVLF